MSRPHPVGRSSRPSLIADIRHDVPLVARWTVSDTSLRPVPPFYPPLNPSCAVFVGDSPPSVVAERIAECLRKRSIAVEFDDESHTATCVTMDRVHFSVNLYRGKMRTEDDALPDFSYGVIVECMRSRGDTISFHHTCRAILKAASGQSDGADRRSRRGPTEVPAEQTRPTLPLARSTSAGLRQLENAVGLLKKDRIDAQRLGMESLVMLTDENTSGKELAVYCSLAVLGASPTESTEGIHTWIVCLLQDRLSPGEGVEPPTVPVSMEDTGASLTGDSAASTGDATAPEIEDTYHGGVLRTLALRAFANALSLLGRDESEMLQSILLEHSPQLVSKSFLAALVDDLAGALRPPAVVAGTRLASAHEAALAAMCLRVLAQHSQKAFSTLTASQQVLAALSKARQSGRASHSMLAQESELAFSVLSQDVRTC